jgi:two-component system CheB/CheR fusion protein
LKTVWNTGIIKSILHSFNLKVKQKNLDLVKEYDSKIPSMLLGDSLRLNQIILNQAIVQNIYTQWNSFIKRQITKRRQRKCDYWICVTDSGIVFLLTK